MPQFAAPFEANDYRIGDLLRGYRMTIPEMQRPYAWTKMEAQELVRDITKLLYAWEHSMPDPQHFFGSLVVLDNQGSPDDVIDGQQRLTTVSVLLGVIQQALADLEKAIIGAGGPQATVNAQNCSMMRTGMRTLLWRVGPIQKNVANSQIPVLNVSPEIRDLYSSLIEIDAPRPKLPGEDTPADHLQDVAEVFRTALIDVPFSNLADNLDKLKHLEALDAVVQKGLVVVRLSTKSASAAYELFESLNARGLGLNALDLLKVWMLAVLANAGVNNSQTADAMRKLSSGDIDKQLAFFYDFYWARTGEKVSPASQKDHKLCSFEARQKLFGDDSIPYVKVTPKLGSLESRIQSEVLRMETLTDVWLDLKGYTDSNDRVPRILGQFGERDWLKTRLDLLLGSTLGHKGAVYPLLMVAAEKMRNNPIDFVRLVHLLERFFFRFRIVCGGSETDIAKVYVKFIRALEANGNLTFPTVIKDLQDTMQKKVQLRGGGTVAKFDDAKFLEFLNLKINYQHANRVKYFFNLIELNSLKKVTNKSVNLKLWSIEHIFPQNPSNGLALPVEELHSMGNLCLLDPVMNKILQNKDFDVKKTKVNQLKQKPVPDKLIIDDNDSRSIFEGPKTVWSSVEITERRQKLEKDALAIFPEQLPLLP